MTDTLKFVVYTAILTWVALLAGSLIRARGWTFAGTMLAIGNRDRMPEPTPLAGRAMRAGQNTLEGFVLFAAIALAAHAAGVDGPKVAMGAQIFFWSRVLYLPVYYAGITYLRTVVWLVGFAGLAIMISAML
ncbi:MAPEG family protein [Variovorax rhizosphaerae]|uniref:MAPEG family protein n=1 Tax=Variovorax rhizosphaerae TaxID=1836200 RepID=A0ABU8WH98_9BURK